MKLIGVLTKAKFATKTTLSYIHDADAKVDFELGRVLKVMVRSHAIASVLATLPPQFERVAALGFYVSIIVYNDLSLIQLILELIFIRFKLGDSSFIFCHSFFIGL